MIKNYIDYFKKEKSKHDKIYYQNKKTGETQCGHKTFFILKKVFLEDGFVWIVRDKNLYTNILAILIEIQIQDFWVEVVSVVAFSEDTEENYKSDVFRRVFLF